MEPNDVLVILKIAAAGHCEWTPESLALELGLEALEIEASLERLKSEGILAPTGRPDRERLKRFLLIELPERFPAKPGKLARGHLTGAKQGPYLGMDLPYTSIWVWPQENGPHWGFSVKPLSPHCCFAVRNDGRLRKLLSVTETLRISGKEARLWAEVLFRQFGLF